MGKRNDDLKDEAGYGKPPRATQFQKGRSGNPRGRPKGSANIKTVVAKMLDMPVPVQQGGRTRMVSTIDAALLQLRADALNNDKQARKELLRLFAEFGPDNATLSSSADNAEEDWAILDAYVARVTGPKVIDDAVPSAPEAEIKK